MRCYKSATGPGQRPGWRWEQVDSDVAELVERLQREGDPFTVASCGGHGQGLPHVVLVDGSRLLVVSEEEHEVFDEHFRARKALGLADDA